jgi:enoyl-CoA hydratase
MNAMSEDMWTDIPRAMAELDADDSARVIVLAGEGKAFSVGIDVELLAGIRPTGRSPAEANKKLYDKIKEFQHTASCLSDSPKPVIAAVHGYCLGAGMDLITACDLRVASRDAVFSVRETRMGLVADIGTLQRLPKLIGPAQTALLALTGKDIDATKAREIGLVVDLYEDREALFAGATNLADQIAAMSPLVTQGVKRVLAANEGRTTAEALDFVAQWNACHLFSEDLREAMSAFAEKRVPDFKGY